MTGQCNCRPNVIGRICDTCAENTYNFKSGSGCELCKCHLKGAKTQQCNLVGLFFRFVSTLPKEFTGVFLGIYMKFNFWDEMKIILQCRVFKLPDINSKQSCRPNPTGKSRSVVECIFVHIAFHIECRFNKYSLLRSYLLGYLPAGK